MGDRENTQPTKKRAAGREISRENPGLDDDEETSEQEIGTFKKASEEVLASRRIVKVRRPPPSSSTPSANPFAGIQLIPSAVPKETATAKVESEKKAPEIVDGNSNAKEETNESKGDTAEPTEGNADVEAITVTVAQEEAIIEAKNSEVEGAKSTELEEAEVGDKKVVEESAEDKGKDNDTKDASDNNIEKSRGGGAFSSFQQLSSGQNAFTGIAGTGFSSSSFSFGVSKDGSSASSASCFTFGQKIDQPFAFNFSNNNGSSLFGTQPISSANKSEKVGFPSMQEVPVETGEENEKAVFTADSVLFEYLEGGWKERGKGEVKVNVPTNGTGKGRLVMRTKGNYRLILNASLYPDMKLTNMDKKGITFACINSGGEGKEGLSTFALKFKDVYLVEEFRSVVTEHKDKANVALRTPENSPKASDE